MTHSKTSYPFDSVVELTAEPNDGWTFDEWQGDLSGSDNPEQITIDGDKNVTAVFVEEQYEINLSTQGNGDGTISVEPAKDFYNYGDEIEITAEPDETSEFKEWDGDISGTENPKNVTVTSDLEIIAIFGGTPEVETADLSDMRINSVTGGGEVTDNGGFEVTDRGVCWSIDPDFTDDVCTVDGNGTGSFNSMISDLTQGTFYYVRAYATNQAGTGYGESIEFVAGYVSHGYVNGLTPSGDSQFEDRSYKLIASRWNEGDPKIWTALNLGAKGSSKGATDDNPDAAGWYFQFNRLQGYYHDGSSRTPGSGAMDTVDDRTDWQIENDPCRAAFGGNWRVPTASEWRGFRSASTEFGGMNGGGREAAFNSDLELHAAGGIDVEGDITSRGSIGYYWSSDQTEGAFADALIFSSTGSTVDDLPR
ncbi:MAG: hypothetical protein U5K72_01055 [Balneolaceae bacterium]|nr:hypothetical protein [Balneolaceae bacterium]